MRVLCATTANDGHFGPVLPFVRALEAAGHEVRIAAPVSYADALGRAGLRHEPFADVPPEVIGPVMGSLPSLTPEEADATVIREVFARIDAQAAYPGVLEVIERWRPDLVLRETAELGSLAAAARAGVPHVHISIGMQAMATRMAELTAEPVDELGRLAGVPDLVSELDGEHVLSLVPELLDLAGGAGVPEGVAISRFHQPVVASEAVRDPAWGDPDRPLVYVTFGTVAGSLPPFAHVYREALDGLADLDAAVLMTVGRRYDVTSLGTLPDNAHVESWIPQDAVLAHASAMLGHGGFGTTMGALAAAVPQSVAPLFSSDQAINGDRVAAVGAGLTSSWGPGAVGPAAAAVPALLADPSYAGGAARVAASLEALPPPSEAVPLLEAMTG